MKPAPTGAASPSLFISLVPKAYRPPSRFPTCVARRTAAKGKEHVFVETDGQVYLVRGRGVWRFPRFGTTLPFPTKETARMDFGGDIVHRMKPELDHHPEEWFQRDDLFSRSDVDDLVKRAVYMTMPRLVAEVVFVKAGRVLMEKASRGFSKGHWNLPGGFLDYGEPPEVGAKREAEEELGVPVHVGRPIGTYFSGFPGKPTFTIGFVYRGTLLGERFRLKVDEIEAVDWVLPWHALEITRNPFARWAIVDVYRDGELEEVSVRAHRSRRSMEASDSPVIFLDRDDVINRGRRGHLRTPAEFAFLLGAKAAMKALRALGYRLAVISNQDPVEWGVLSERQLRGIHERMLRELAAAGVEVANVYYCPHHAFDDCACRKPRPGLLLAACRDLGASPRDAWMVGDKVGDVQAGKAIGAATAFFGDAGRREKFAEELAVWKPDLLVDSLAAFAKALRRGTVPPPRRPAYT